MKKNAWPEQDAQPPVVALPHPALRQSGYHSPIGQVAVRQAFEAEKVDELYNAEVRARYVPFGKANDKLRGGFWGIRVGKDARADERSEKADNAATDRPVEAAFVPVVSSRCSTMPDYFLSVLGEPLLSSTTHGQKFWGLRVEAAFLMTVIFMSLLRFC